jgi:hypothetical protein
MRDRRLADPQHAVKSHAQTSAASLSWRRIARRVGSAAAWRRRTSGSVWRFMTSGTVLTSLYIVNYQYSDRTQPGEGTPR